MKIEFHLFIPLFIHKGGYGEDYQTSLTAVKSGVLDH